MGLGPGEQKRILIFSASFGGGHRPLAEAVAAYCRAKLGPQAEVRVVDFFEEFMPEVSVLAKFGYQQSAEFLPAVHGDFDALSQRAPDNAVVQALAGGGLARAAALVSEFAPHAVISTFPVAGGAIAEMRAHRRFVSATLVTDYDARGAWVHPSTDLHFVACKEARESLVLGGVAWDRIIVSGIPVSHRFARVGTRGESRVQTGLADRFTALLIASTGQSFDVAEVASRVAASGIQVAVVTGRNERLKSRLDVLERKSPLVRAYGFIDTMPQMMRAADVHVARAGGLVTAEALAVGLPLVICPPMPGHEVHNVDFLVNAGVCLLARDDTDVAEKVRFLSTHPDRLRQMVSNAGTLGTADAVQTVCERVLADVR